ncbi:MAG: tetratricopeptide repeat protein, partial [Sedimentisphaerales bacterium]|nr:tetratricopeptide repeat protein [Sedimentisphaerales bacterium]
HINKAVIINPRFSAARDTLGVVLMEQGKLNEAIACFEEVIRRDEKWKDSARAGVQDHKQLRAGRRVRPVQVWLRRPLSVLVASTSKV